MGFNDDIQQGIDDIFDLTGADAIYTPENAFPKSIRVLSGKRRIDQGGRWPGAMGTEEVIIIRKTDVADPKPKDICEIGTTPWVVTGISDDNRFLWELSVKRDIKPHLKR